MATKLRLRQRTARSRDLETSIAHRARHRPIDDRRLARRRRRGAAKKIRRIDTAIADRHRSHRSRRTDVSLPVRGSPPWPLPHHQRRPSPPPHYWPVIWTIVVACWTYWALCPLFQTLFLPWLSENVAGIDAFLFSFSSRISLCLSKVRAILRDYRQQVNFWDQSQFSPEHTGTYSCRSAEILSVFDSQRWKTVNVINLLSPSGRRSCLVPRSLLPVLVHGWWNDLLEVLCDPGLSINAFTRTSKTYLHREDARACVKTWF